MKNKILPCLLLSLFFLTQCGSEVGRIPVTQIGPISSAQIKITGNKKISFWTRLDVEYDGNVDMNYFISFLKENTLISQTMCDPFDVSTKIKSVTTDINDHHTKSYLGKMNCQITLVESGKYTVNAKLLLVPDSGFPKLKQADLIFKQ